MSVIDSALKTITGLLVREPVTVVRGIVGLVRTALAQGDKQAAIERATRAALGKNAVEKLVDERLKRRARR